MLTSSYIDAGTRCVLPFCPDRGRLGLAFDVLGQPTVRLALTPLDAVSLRNCLTGYINSLAGSHSDASELMPSAPVSVPSDGVNT